MKRFRDFSVPARSRDWFTEAEFENTMDDLRAQAGEGVFTSREGINVDLVLLKAYEVNPDFVDLPLGVLGRTTFYPDGRLHVEISRTLAEDAEHSLVARRRLRSTMAHECGHIAFHRHQFLVDGSQQTLFGSAAPIAPTILCRGEAIDDRVRHRDGREYQANRGMAALLLPRTLLTNHSAEVLKTAGFETLRDAVKRGKGEAILRELCDIFDVSLQMMLYRVQDLMLLPREDAQSEFGW